MYDCAEPHCEEYALDLVEVSASESNTVVINILVHQLMSLKEDAWMLF